MEVKENQIINENQNEKYNCKFFDYNDELVKIALNIRYVVFVEGQNVPLERENDNLDKDCMHGLIFVNINSSSIPIGAVRLQYDSKNVVHIQRFCILKEYRKEGYGTIFFGELMNYLKNDKNLTTIMLSSQSYIVNFYKKFGFTVCSDSYQDAGIEHFDMILKI